MTIFLRKQQVHDVIEGRKPGPWSEDDYAVVDGTLIGRTYKERLPVGEKWRWFLQVMGAQPNSGIADTLEEAKAQLAASYQRCREGKK